MRISSYISTHKERFLEELSGWLRIPSVSTDAAFAKDVEAAAKYLEQRLREAGAEQVLRFPTAVYPVVYAECRAPREEAPTVLVYGHYDVQPADPYELWKSPPFEPTVRGDRIYARGACDDKGQAYMHVKVLEMMRKLEEQPCHLKFLFEGEEEIGSPSLEDFLKKEKERLLCDAVLVSDTAMVSPTCPSITVGLRGLCYIEVQLKGPSRDLHSGEYGGVVDNPIIVLSRMLSSLKDTKGRISIPGFYDKVRPLSEADLAQLQSIPFDEKSYKDRLGLSTLFGEEGYNYWARTGARPTLDANGIWGGYTKEGAKTVLPSTAAAKISMRLVPEQDPEEIYQLTKGYLKQLLPPTMHMKVKVHHGSGASLLSTDSIAYRAAEKAIEDTWGKSPISVRGGGSIPIVPLFEKYVGHPPVLMGFGLEEDSLHAPNESFRISHFLKGMETISAFYRYFCELSA